LLELETTNQKHQDIQTAENTTDIERKKLNNEAMVYRVSKKQKDDMSIYYQNISSLRPQTQDKSKSTLNCMKELKADLIGLTETSVNWYDNQLYKKFKSSLHKQYQNSTISVSSSNIIHSSNYLPGGTATIIVGKWSNRQQNQIEDTTGMG
jgi:hypothetical protein